MHNPKRSLLLSAALVGVATLAAVLGAQEVPGDDPGDGGPERCSGTTAPVCRTVETCVGAGSTRQCTKDYYYFP